MYPISIYIYIKIFFSSWCQIKFQVVLIVHLTDIMRLFRKWRKKWLSYLFLMILYKCFFIIPSKYVGGEILVYHILLLGPRNLCLICTPHLFSWWPALAFIMFYVGLPRKRMPIFELRKRFSLLSLISYWQDFGVI